MEKVPGIDVSTIEVNENKLEERESSEEAEYGANSAETLASAEFAVYRCLTTSYRRILPSLASHFAIIGL